MSRYDNCHNKLIDIEYDITKALEALDRGQGCQAREILQDSLEYLKDFLEED